MLLLLCTGFGAHWTSGELVLLNRQSEKHNQQKLKCFFPLWELNQFSRGHTQEMAQGKGKQQEEEEGRPPSSTAANPHFKAAHHAFSIVVPRLERESQVFLVTPEGDGLMHQSSKVWCEVTTRSISTPLLINTLSFSLNEFGFWEEQILQDHGHN